MLQDTLMTALKSFNIDHLSWEKLAEDRTGWQGAIGKGALLYEAKCIADAKLKR